MCCGEGGEELVAMNDENAKGLAGVDALILDLPHGGARLRSRQSQNLHTSRAVEQKGEKDNGRGIVEFSR